MPVPGAVEADPVPLSSVVSAGPPPQGIANGEGMHISMQRVDGLTDEGILTFPFYFQLPPTDTFEVSQAYDHTEYQTVNRQTFSRPAARGLRTVSFSTLFLDFDPTWGVLSDGPYPPEAAETLLEICAAGTPFLLSAHNMDLWGEGVYDVRTRATLRNVNITERAGEIDSRYTDVQFSEWQRPELSAKKLGKRPKRAHPPSSKTQIFSPTAPGNLNDTLRTVSLRYYGTYNLWRRIAQANGLTSLPPDTPISRHVPRIIRLKVPPR